MPTKKEGPAPGAGKCDYASDYLGFYVSGVFGAVAGMSSHGKVGQSHVLFTRVVIRIHIK